MTYLRTITGADKIVPFFISWLFEKMLESLEILCKAQATALRGHI
jgi:hypothetical protein